LKNSSDQKDESEKEEISSSQSQLIDILNRKKKITMDYRDKDSLVIPKS